MHRLSILAALTASLTLGTGCPEGPVKNGKPCDEGTVCEGVCLLGMPGGMCTSICTVLPCPGGGTCLNIAGDNYCMPSCTSNDRCRTGYTCVLGVCRPPVGTGEACEEDSDCESQMCEGGLCSTDCEAQTDCPEGLYCEVVAGHCLADECNPATGLCLRPCAEHGDCAPGTYCTETSTGALHCKQLPDSPPPAGTLGASCALDDCQSGLTCRTLGEGDPDAYCTKTCTAESDCNPDMLCRSDGDVDLLCLRRAFCEACRFDGQCGFASEKCVSTDPTVVSGQAYCSTACDPEDDGTCPLDADCLEALYCEDTGTWVASCDWCSGACGPSETPTYQCFQYYGACGGEGELCAPCLHDGQCDEGLCLSVFAIYEYDQENLSCSAPCGANGTCPDGFWCVDVTGQAPQCVPRTGSCELPSRGRLLCESCNAEHANAGMGDCLRGMCLTTNGLSRCLDFCGAGYPACPAFMTCKTLTEYSNNWTVCQPDDATPVDLGGNCTEWQACITACPTGPASCDANAPDYCLAP